MTNGQEPKASDGYKSLPPGQLAVKRRPGAPKSRQCVRIGGLSPNIQIVPFNENVDTLQRAIAERVFLVKEDGEFKPPPKPKQGLFESRLSQTRSLLIPHLPSTAPLSFRDTVETFKGCKKRRYEQAWKNIVSTRTDVAKEAAISVFVKYEKTDRTNKSDPVPRVISPRKPEFNLRIARYLRKIEEPIFEALGKLFGHKTVMKGVTAEQTAELLKQKWEKFNNPIAVGLDASRFDQHVSREALEFEHSIYEKCFPRKKDRKKLMDLLKHQLVNRCSGYTVDGSVKYTVNGTRMSGDMNTSLGNCVLMCMMIHAYAQFAHVNVQLANNGDDCVVFMEKKDLGKFSVKLDSWFREMGFNMVVEKPSVCLEQIEFCQTRPVFDGKTWVMSRNPWTAIAKDSVLLNNPKNVSSGYIKQWMDAVGTGGIALAGGLPIFQAFYNMYKRNGCRYRRGRKRKLTILRSNEMLPWYMREISLHGGRSEVAVSDDARASFYFAWGVTPEEQICLEEYYDFTLIKDEYGEWHPRKIFPTNIA